MPSIYSEASPQSRFASRFPQINLFSQPNLIFATPFVIFLETNSNPRKGDS